MTFERFKSIVKQHNSNIEVTPHGGCLSSNSISVCVVFNPPYGKTYFYNGSYCDILNKLGVKACYRSQITTLENNIERLETTHGKVNIFTKRTINNANEIERCKTLLLEMQRDYIIIE